MKEWKVKRMSEETIQEQPSNEGVVQVSEAEVRELEAQVTQKEEAKVAEAVAPLSDELAKLKAELEATKKANEEIRARQKAEEEKAKLEAELAKEKEFQNQVNKKHVVPETTNPVAPAQAEAPKEPQLSPEQEWRIFESKAGRLSASIDDLEN